VKLVEEVLPPPKPKWQPKPEEMAQNVPWNWNRDDWRGARERYNLRRRW
jgi:hypothetical protein